MPRVTATASPSSEELTRGLLRDIGRDIWGIPAYRPKQEAAMRAHLDRHDSLCVFATGFGKSACFQIPADYHRVTRKQLTVVICPLISLMQDQVEHVRQVLAAAYDPRSNRPAPNIAAQLHSHQHPPEQVEIEARARRGELALLYMSPERFCSPGGLTLLSECNLSCVVVDEAHCISEWGHDFRPAYAELGRYIDALRRQQPDISVHAYTATAPPDIRQAIADALDLRDPLVLVGEFHRPNLRLRVVPCREGERFFVIESFVKKRPGQTGIIYCITRMATERLAQQLKERGFKAEAYHAGLEADQRRGVQDAFACDGIDVVVATVAFGMGIHKADVRYVLHAAMPPSLELYHQEIGRAGRDGEPAECVLFYDDTDFDTWQEILLTDERYAANDPFDGKLQALKRMDHFCQADRTCRHRLLLEHLDRDSWADDPEHKCGACDVCVSAPACVSTQGGAT